MDDGFYQLYVDAHGRVVRAWIAAGNDGAMWSLSPSCEQTPHVCRRSHVHDAPGVAGLVVET